MSDVVKACCLLAVVVGFLFFRPAAAKEPTLPDWQLVTRASCLQVGDQVDLRTNDGVTIKSVAKLKVAHVDTRGGVVTFVERRP